MFCNGSNWKAVNCDKLLNLITLIKLLFKLLLLLLLLLSNAITFNGKQLRMNNKKVIVNKLHHH